MIRRALLFGAPLLATAAMLALPTLSQAQMMTVPGNMSGGRGGYYGGSGWGGGYNGGSGWGGYANPGYRYYSPGAAYNSYPNYSYYSNPGYSTNQGYSSGYATYPNNNYYSQGAAPSGYQAFYPSDPNANRVAYVRLQVPPDAEVWFDGQKTQQSGRERLFVSPPLDRSKSYVYEVKARWTENGQPVERTRKVTVQAGTEATANLVADQQEQR